MVSHTKSLGVDDGVAQSKLSCGLRNNSGVVDTKLMAGSNYDQPKKRGHMVRKYKL
jgi:hypothetical protein